MVSHQQGRRWTVMATVAALSLGLVPASSTADPEPPATAPDAARQLAALSRQAEQLTEEWLAAQDQQRGRRREADQARADGDRARTSVSEARAQEDLSRKDVDRFANSVYQGARLSELATLLNGRSHQEVLERMSFLELLAVQNKEVVDRFSAARRQAETGERQTAQAQAKAVEAEQQAAKAEADLARRKQDMDRQIQNVRAQLGRLSTSDRNAYTGGGQTNYRVDAPASGLAQQAMQQALAQQGKPYEWAAAGPGSFDCSGLLYWAYQQVGVTLPRSSREQARFGTPVSPQQLQPGDLVALYNPVSHIGIYVGEGKMVHAPQGGDVVKVSPVKFEDVTATRRVS